MQNNLITPNLVDRLKGVVTFKAPVYKAIAEDTTATNNSAIIVIVVSVIVGIVNGAISGSLIGGLITQVLAGVVGWAFSSWLTAFVAKKFFSGDTNTGEMLRVFGHSYIFQLLGIIPVIGPIIGSVLQAIGNFFGVREVTAVTGFDRQDRERDSKIDFVGALRSFKSRSLPDRAEKRERAT